MPEGNVKQGIEKTRSIIMRPTPMFAFKLRTMEKGWIQKSWKKSMIRFSQPTSWAAGWGCRRLTELPKIMAGLSPLNRNWRREQRSAYICPSWKMTATEINPGTQTPIALFDLEMPLRLIPPASQFSLRKRNICPRTAGVGVA